MGRDKTAALMTALKLSLGRIRLECVVAAARERSRGTHPSKEPDFFSLFPVPQSLCRRRRLKLVFPLHVQVYLEVKSLPLFTIHKAPAVPLSEFLI